MGDRAERSWQALILEVPGHLDGDLTAALGGMALGSETLPAAAGLSRVRIYLRPGAKASEAVPLARTALLAHGVPSERCHIGTEIISDGRWVENYQASLKPFRIGRAFEVHPAGDKAVSANLTPLLLVPGRAFGTGEHPTTRLCAGMLERSVRKGSRWLDLGCGSAILAMIAYHCGATLPVAVDDDPEAVTVAREVLGANGLTEAIDLRLGSIESCGESAFDGIVANISGYFTSREAEKLHARLVPGGALIASGFTIGEVDEVRRHISGSGLRPVAMEEQDGWAALLAAAGEPEP